MDSEAVERLVNGRMPFQAKVGVRVESIRADGIDLVVPFDPANLAVPGILSAGVMFLLGETAGGAILWTVFPEKEFGLVARRVEIRYLRPADSDLRARPRVADIRWDTPEGEIRAAGSGRAAVPVDILGGDGRKVARMTAEYAISRRNPGRGRGM